MKGAVAAGHPLTAQAGADILAEGGNAVDACIAAAFASWVAESPLTGPGAGGFMLVHRASDGSDRLLDFFVAFPGRGATERAAQMDEVAVEFDCGDMRRGQLAGEPVRRTPGTGEDQRPALAARQSGDNADPVCWRDGEHAVHHDI